MDRSAPWQTRAASAAGAAALTLALGYALALGFALPRAARPESAVRLIQVTLPPPARPRPEARHRTAKPRREAAAAPPNLRSEPTQIVAPRPEIVVPVPPPLPAAPVAGAGAQNSAGSAEFPGPGAGAGGVGDGRGSGGSGNGDGGGGGTPPRWIKGRIKDSDYPRGAGQAGIGGTVSVRYTVETSGRVTNCRITASSGNAELDATTCRLIEERFRYRPSRDEDGTPVPATIVEEHSWVIDNVPSPPPAR